MLRITKVNPNIINYNTLKTLPIIKYQLFCNIKIIPIIAINI